MNARPAILITGAARRVGAATALYFARAGYDIALHYNQSKSEAEALQKEIEAVGADCRLFAHDLAGVKGFPALMAAVKKSLPRCAALINNASIFERASLMETDEALFDRQFAVNFKAPFFLTQAFAKTFGKGAVINILDTDIETNGISHFAYLLSKKALAEFTRAAARELGPDIRVNGVCPGIMLPSNELDLPYMKRLEADLPLKALALPEDAAKAVRWLCESTFVTGQLIHVDGGQHLL